MNIINMESHKLLGISICIGILIIISIYIGCNKYTIHQSFLNYSNNINPWIRTQYDQLARKDNHCSIIRSETDSMKGVIVQIVDASCEDGLPHTSDTNTIRMTESVWKNPGRDSTLIHERVHILQRRNPEKWAAFYKKYWNYTLPTSLPSHIPSHLLARIRGNPDTAENPWVCWKNRYWFFPIYISESNPKLRDTEIYIWDSLTNSITMELPHEWKSQFCSQSGDCPVQWEHPHELSAEYITHTSASPAAFTLYKIMEDILPNVK